MRTLLLLLLATLLLAGCPPGKEPDAVAGSRSETRAATTEHPTTEGRPGEPTLDAPDEPPARTAQEPLDFTPGGPIPDEALGEFRVELDVAIDGEDAGTLTFALWPEIAVTSRNFLRYCAEDFYAGTRFHRILRELLVQGGDPAGDGSGVGPYGTIEDELTLDRRFGHAYGVISMAHGEEPDSASCQFFVCTADNPDVWALDGEFAAFGRLTSGVATLERIADLPVAFDGSGEESFPNREATVTAARVVRGRTEPTEPSEPIERPQPDLGGEPEVVALEYVLITLYGRDLPEPRSEDEAAALAAIALERARAGEDFEALVRELGDEAESPQNPRPGLARVANDGVHMPREARKMFEAFQEISDYRHELHPLVQSGEMAADRFRELLDKRRAEVLARVLPQMVKRRRDFPVAFGDVAFGLEVGEIGFAARDLARCPTGWYVIKRVE